MTGTVVVVVHGDGSLMGSGVCTAQGGPAGWTVEENQERRARDEAWGAVVRNCCQPDVAEAVMRAGRLEPVSLALRGMGWSEHTRRFEIPQEAGE